jgi:hypothetical protein
VDALKKRYALLPAQVDTEKVFEKFEPLQHRGGHRVQDMVPVIPSKRHRREPLNSEKELYKLREKVEQFFNNLQQLRRIATRYEKLSKTFLALIHLVAVWIIIK